MEAPASIANLGPGFDVMAMAIKGFSDEVSLKISKGTGQIRVLSSGGAPDGEKNVAYTVVKESLALHNANNVYDVTVIVDKGIPLSAGLGGSGATSIATAFGMESFFEEKPDFSRILSLAGRGEKMVSGTPHYDNIGASLFGGLVIIDPEGPIVHRIETKIPLIVGVLIPSAIIRHRFSSGKTRFFRRLLPTSLSLETHVKQVSNALQALLGFMTGDGFLLRNSVSTDHIAERIRAQYIPGYWDLKKLALDEGALGFNISGAGPSIFFLHTNEVDARRICRKLREKWLEHKVDSVCHVTRPSNFGARIMEAGVN